MMSVSCIHRDWATGLWKASAIAALCLAIQIPRVEAATYYVSSSTGNDTNPGTSTNAPWQTLHYVNAQSGGSFFQPGDSILLKAGDSYDGPLKFGRAGTSNAPIIVSRYGSGSNPIIYGDHPSATWSAVPGHTGVYSATIGSSTAVERVYDVNGTKYNLTTQGTNTLDGWLSSFVATNWGGIDASVIYIRTPDDNPPPAMHLFEWSAASALASYVILDSLDVRNASIGMTTSGVGPIIRNCSVQDTLNIGIFCGNCTYAEVATNTITRTGEDSIYLSQGGHKWVHHNMCSYCGGDTNGVNILSCHIAKGEQCGIGLQQGTNNLVEHNSISYVYGSFFDYWVEVGTTVQYNYGFHSGGTAYPHGTGLKVCNNIFVPDGSPGIACYHHTDTNSPAPDAGNNLVYNNVVYNFTSYGLFTGTAYGDNVGVQFRNNILVTTATNIMLWQFPSVVDSDYNCFYCSAGTANGWAWNSHSYSTLAALQAASGLEVHSLYTNPQFVSTNPVVAADFQLKRTSPCIDVGQNLKSVGLLAPAAQYQDYLGTLIPQGAGPDIGAYEMRLLGPASDLHVIPH